MNKSMTIFRCLLIGLFCLQISVAAYATPLYKELKQPEYFSTAQQGLELPGQPLPFSGLSISTVAIRQLAEKLLLFNQLEQQDKTQKKNNTKNIEPTQNGNLPTPETHIIVDDVIVMLSDEDVEEGQMANVAHDFKENSWYFKSPG